MPILNPEHLFEQADKLLSSRQVDLRRAISSAYYGLFHFCLTAAADEFVGVTQRATARYGLVYRSVDHRTLKDTCDETMKRAPSAKYAPYVPAGGFGPPIQDFSSVIVDLQHKRHRADYNPLLRFSNSDARLAVSMARGAIDRFKLANEDHRKVFLTLLVCPPRADR